MECDVHWFLFIYIKLRVSVQKICPILTYWRVIGNILDSFR